MMSQYDAYMLHTGLARLHAFIRVHTPTCPGIHMHAHECMHAHTHRSINNTYCFFTATMTRERASMIRYTYIAPLLFITSTF